MIYYFSGTGNSKFVAETLSNLLSMENHFIPTTSPSHQLHTSENIVFVFPVYSWGVPPLVIDFINLLPSSLWNSMKVGQYSLSCVMVCGDEVALAPEMFTKVMKLHDVKVQSIWSVIMPNNYVLLPGFDVDSKEVEKRKLEECQGRIIQIAEGISQNMEVIDVVRGGMAWLKTKCIYPLFKKWGISPKKWKSTSACTACGKCVRICPERNIKIDNGHAVWDTRCCSCLACYHICPYHAVAYGNATKKKGQYFFPKLY